MLEQQYYTSAPKRLDGHAGFGVKAQSPRLEPQVARKLEEFARYGKPHRLDDSDVQAMPVSFSFYEVEPGTWGLTHCVYIGQDFSGRWGNFFAHALSLKEESVTALDGAPVRLWGSPIWVTSDTTDRTELPPLPLPPAAGLSGDSVLRFLNEDPERRTRFPELLQAVLSWPATGRRVILVEDPDAVIQWVRALTLALPRPVRRQLTFSTYQRDPYAMSAAVTGTRADGDFRFTPSEYQFQFAVFHFAERTYSPGLTPERASTLLSGAILRGELRILEHFSELAEVLGVRELGELDDLAAAYEALSGEPGVASLEILTAALRVLQPAEGRGLGAAFDWTRQLIQPALADVDLKRLALLLPVYHQLALGARRAPTFQSDLTGLLQRHLCGSSGRDLLELVSARSAELPLLENAARTALTAATWGDVLAELDPDAPLVQGLWPLIQSAVAASEAAGDYRIWRGLAAWSARHRTSFVFDQLTLRLRSVDQRSLPALRATVDAIIEGLDPVQHTDLLNASLELLAAAVRLNDRLWRDDVFRLVDAAVSAGKEGQALSLLVTRGNAMPAAMVLGLAAFLELQPNLASRGAELLLANGGTPSPELLRLSLADPRLDGLTGELRRIAARNGTLPEVVGAQIHALPSARVAELAPKIVLDAVAILTANRSGGEAFDRLLQAVPEIRRSRDLHGRILLARLSVSSLTLIEDTQDLTVVAAALRETEPSRVTPEVRLSYGLSALAAALRQGERDWTKLRKHVQLSPEIALSPTLYGAYLKQVFAHLHRHRVAPSSQGDLFLVLAVDGAPEVFAQETARHLAGLKCSPEIRCEMLVALLEKMAERWNGNAASLPAAVHLIRQMRGGHQEWADTELRIRLRGHRQQLHWWKECYGEARRGLLSRLFGR